GTLPKKIRLTREGHDLIEAWAQVNDVSFSAAIETLARIGMGQATTEAIAPAVVSTMRRELAKTYDRIIRLTLYATIEAGIASRLAGSALLQQLKTPEGKADLAKYDQIKRAARTDARRSLAQARIGKLIEELFRDGDRQG